MFTNCFFLKSVYFLGKMSMNTELHVYFEIRINTLLKQI